MFTFTQKEKHVVIGFCLIIVFGRLVSYFWQPHYQAPVTDGPQSSSSQLLLNLSIATRDELEQLPGIGPKLAQRLIDYREENQLVHLEDLRQIKGFSNNIIKKIQPHVYIRYSND